MSVLRHLAVLGSTVAALLTFAAPAQAGRVVATGHPFDLACATRAAPDPADGCQALRAIIGWARAGAPDREKPLLLLQRNDGPLQTALSAAYQGGSPPSLQVVDPSASYVAQMAIDTAAYSAMVVASDGPGGSGLSIPSAVRVKLYEFFVQGGGMVLLPGSASDVLPVGALDDAGPRPYALTSEGRDLGLTSGDPLCCDLRRTFAEPPSASALMVAERDGDGRPATVFGSGIYRGAQLTSPIELPRGSDDGPKAAGGAQRCQSRRRFRIHVKRLPGLRYARVAIRVAGRRAKVLKGGRIRSTVDLRGLPKGRYSVRITVTATDGQTFTGARRYRTCEPRRLPGGRNRL